MGGVCGIVMLPCVSGVVFWSVGVYRVYMCIVVLYFVLFVLFVVLFIVVY